MKKTFLFAALIFSIAANAQIQKGKVVMYAGLSVQNQKVTFLSQTPGVPDDIRKVNNSDFTFGVGAFVSNSLMLGINVGYQTSTQDQGTAEYTADAIPVGAVMKWYKKLGNKFYYNLTLSGTYSHLNIEQKQRGSGSDNITTGKGDTYSARVSPLQITYALSKKFLIEAGFAYIEYSANKTVFTYPSQVNYPKQETRVNSFNLNLSPAVSTFTVSYVF